MFLMIELNWNWYW